MSKVSIERLIALPQDVDVLVASSEMEGFIFIRRLVDEWLSAENRFDKPGEMLFGAFVKNSLVGLCGVNQDPYSDRFDVGRLRHLYVGSEFRGSGIGRKLVTRCLNDVSDRFQKLRLRTPTKDASSFYVHLGFSEVNESAATHDLLLVDRNA